MGRNRALLASGLALVAAVALLPGTGRAQSGKPSEVPAQIVHAFDTLFAGPHVGQRAVHAKGLLCDGIFTPAPGAVSLSRAQHLIGGDVPILVRFSNFAAVPGMPDGAPDASPRGMSIKFLLPGGRSTDIVAHSYNGFPAGTPEDFLAFLRALPDPVALASLEATHPAARAFLDDPKPAPASYGTEEFFGVNAFRFTNAAGTDTVGRYRIVPLAGVTHLSAAAAAASPPDFLASAMKAELEHEPVEFRLEVQLAGPGDVIDDGSVIWPADRPVVELGTIKVVALTAMDDKRRTDLTFIPANLVSGISVTHDPMLVARTDAYRISARRRLNPE